jgi:hypothetical protein
MAVLATRYFLDTEFIERPGILQLVSLALVDERGRELYEVSSEFDESLACDFVRQNVLPRLGPGPRTSLHGIRDAVLDFTAGTQPEFWGYYADYDWVAFCWLFGAMVDLPRGWPMYCLDLAQVMHEHDVRRFQLPFLSDSQAHNALADARWLREAHTATWDIVRMRRSASAA